MLRPTTSSSLILTIRTKTIKHCLLLLVSSVILGCSETKEPVTVKEKDSAYIGISTDSAFVSDLVENSAKDSALVSNLEEKTGKVVVDCVFDTSTYKFTKEALFKFKKNISFHWDKKTSNALVKLNNSDSLILQIGGCNHFTYSAIYITDDSKFEDRAFLIQKAKWMAKNFFSNGFDEKYVYSIENNLFKLEDSKRENFLYYTIIDSDSTLTDHIYEGWTIEKAGGKTRLHLVGYQN